MRRTSFDQARLRQPFADADGLPSASRSDQNVQATIRSTRLRQLSPESGQGRAGHHQLLGQRLRRDIAMIQLQSLHHSLRVERHQARLLQHFTHAPLRHAAARPAAGAYRLGQSARRIADCRDICRRELLADRLQLLFQFAQRIGCRSGRLAVGLVGQHFDARTLPQLRQAIGWQLAHVHHHGIRAQLRADLRHGIRGGISNERDDLNRGVLSWSFHQN